MGRTAIIFAGQGSQYEKQGALIYEKFPEIRYIYDFLGDELKKVSFEGTLEEISKTEKLQPLMVAFQLAAYNLIKDKIPNADAVCGLSLGEYSAITIAGIVSEKKALELVKKRGELMGEASKMIKSKMLAFVNATADMVAELIGENEELSGRVYIANINAPKQIVVSGEENAIDILRDKAKEKHLIAKPLAVSGAFHTPFMDSAGRGFGEYVKNVEFNKPLIDYYPNLTGEKYKGQDIYYVMRPNIEECGLATTIRCVLSHAKYAAENGYRLVMDYQNRKNPYLMPEEVGKVNAWEYYFHQPCDVSLSDIDGADNVIVTEENQLSICPTDSMEFYTNVCYEK